jgi:hypothetical protein
MENFENLSRKLLADGEVTLSHDRYDDGREGEPDIMINHVIAGVITDKQGYKHITIYLSKEDERIVVETYGLYKIPMIEDLKILS